MKQNRFIDALNSEMMVMKCDIGVIYLPGNDGSGEIIVPILLLVWNVKIEWDLYRGGHYLLTHIYCRYSPSVSTNNTVNKWTSRDTPIEKHILLNNTTWLIQPSLLVWERKVDWKSGELKYYAVIKIYGI